MYKSILNIQNLIIFTPSMINVILIMLIMKSSKNIILPPMLFMIMLILLTMMITYKMNFIYYSWMSYILFLIMIGGLMVIYMYITSLTNNELFFINIKYMLINLIKILPILIVYIYIIKNIEINLFNMNNSDSWLMNNFNNQSLNSLYKNNNNKSTKFIMLYLYYSMICVMNICYKFKAPLRQMTF